MNEPYFCENRDNKNRLVVQKLPLGEIVATIEENDFEEDLSNIICNFLNKI